MANTFLPATYSKQDIYNFLKDQKRPNAASDWWLCIGTDGRITLQDAATWFKDYFPRGTSAQLFRTMQSVCTGHLELEKI
jgi:hypothetical protein